MMIRFLIVLLIATCQLLSAAAQQDSIRPKHQWSHYAFVGYNIGALTPLNLPNTIRRINSYSPDFSPSLGYGVNFHLKGRWGIETGVRVDWKCMRVSDKVQYFHTLISVNNSSLEGDFSGTNVTRVRNIYLSLPIMAVFYCNDRWHFNMGPYFALLLHPSFSGSVSDGYIRKGDALGEKVTILHNAFNFSDNLRRFDLGIQGGAGYALYKRLGVKADVSWGLLPAFPSAFKGMPFNMYNLFATIGLSYKIGK